jgi:hypothetical protein
LSNSLPQNPQRASVVTSADDIHTAFAGCPTTTVFLPAALAR